MKISSQFHVLVFFMAILIFSMPFVTLAQQNPVESRAKAAAERDVEADINKPMWFAVGCFLPGFGLLGPYLYRPPIPTGRTIGKSPEYVAFYTDTYRTKMEQRQFTYAAAGCITGAVVSGGCWLLLVMGAAVLD